jgi:hypothetical protein
MKSSASARAALIALPLMAFALYAAFNWFRLEEESTWSGAGQAAREDDYLAYGRLLERMGRPPRSLQAPAELESLPRGGTLLIAARRLAYMTPQRVRGLVAWVEGGGHLVAEWERRAIDDPLVDAFGITRGFPEEPRIPGAARPFDPEEARNRGANILTFDWPQLGAALRARAGTRTGELFDDGSREDMNEVRQGKRVVAVSFPAGRGRVTFLPSLRFLRNEAIGELDHAELGWRLASQAGPVTLYLRLRSAGLMDWIQRDAWPAFAAGALLLLLWLARIMPRFGPLEPDAPPARRSLVEHIAASGRFLWSRGAANTLLEAVRERAARSARRKGLSTRSLASHAPGAATAPLDAAAFTHRMASLQKVEQEAQARTSPRKGKK